MSKSENNTTTKKISYDPKNSFNPNLNSELSDEQYLTMLKDILAQETSFLKRINPSDDEISLKAYKESKLSNIVQESMKDLELSVMQGFINGVLSTKEANKVQFLTKKGSKMSLTAGIIVSKHVFKRLTLPKNFKEKTLPGLREQYQYEKMNEEDKNIYVKWEKHLMNHAKKYQDDFNTNFPLYSFENYKEILKENRVAREKAAAKEQEQNIKRQFTKSKSI